MSFLRRFYYSSDLIIATSSDNTHIPFFKLQVSKKKPSTMWKWTALKTVKMAYTLTHLYMYYAWQGPDALLYGLDTRTTSHALHPEGHRTHTGSLCHDSYSGNRAKELYQRWFYLRETKEEKTEEKWTSVTNTDIVLCDGIRTNKH